MLSSFRGACARTLLLFCVLVSCGCGSDDHGESLFSLAKLPSQPEPDLSNLFAYQPSSPWSSVIADCVKAESLGESCSLETLPLLGQETPNPTVEDVMNRVVVSHAWMGDRFRQALQALKPDVLTLLKGVTAVVIDDDIRPSFYYGGTAAIYLDPAYLWLTDAEKATIFREEDFRSDFGLQLSFVPLWRYTLNNAYASRDFSLSEPGSRRIDDLVYRIAALLYHELAHANDVIPQARVGTLQPQLSVYENVLNLRGLTVADELQKTFSLTSRIWPGLARVIYGGEQATGIQRDYAAGFVGADFDADSANETYAYSHPAEDVSMLFEETMMKYHYKLERDIAFTPAPTQIDYSCQDLVVQWGVRNRIGKAAVKERAAFVASRLLPGTNLSGFLAALPAPVPLRNGVDWCTNLNPGSTPSPLGIRSLSVESDRDLTEDMTPPHGG